MFADPWSKAFAVKVRFLLTVFKDETVCGVSCWQCIADMRVCQCGWVCVMSLYASGI